MPHFVGVFYISSPIKVKVTLYLFCLDFLAVMSISDGCFLKFLKDTTLKILVILLWSVFHILLVWMSQLHFELGKLTWRGRQNWSFSASLIPWASVTVGCFCKYIKIYLWIFLLLFTITISIIWAYLVEFDLSLYRCYSVLSVCNQVVVWVIPFIPHANQDFFKVVRQFSTETKNPNERKPACNPMLEWRIVKSSFKQFKLE